MSESATARGRYLGNLITEWLPDGRLMRLVEPFGFVDENQLRWPVPPGTKVDGASIPQVLWSITGGPFEGKYRNASVIHDYYCDVRLRPWRMVHRVFYNAMRVSDVSESRAKLLYAGVLFGGPRWSDTVVDNANLPRPQADDRLFCIAHSEFDDGVLQSVRVGESMSTPTTLEEHVELPGGAKGTLDLTRMDKLIHDHNPTISEIDKAIDVALQLNFPQSY